MSWGLGMVFGVDGLWGLRGFDQSTDRPTDRPTYTYNKHVPTHRRGPGGRRSSCRRP